MIRLVFLLTASLVTVFSTDNGVFQVAPEGTVLAPVNTTVQLNCSVHQGYRFSSWIVDGQDVRDFRNLFRDRGIEEVMHSETNSSLYISGTSDENNGVMVKCVATTTQTINTIESEVEVMFYGPPPSPANLSVDTSDPNSLNISWSLTFIEGIEGYFKLNITKEGPITVQGEHYIFIPDRDEPCALDQYSVQVTAVNLAGSSPSVETTVTLFPLPNISAALDTLQVSLEKTQNSDILLNVTFANATTCPEYPIIEYTLVLEDYSASNGTLHQPEISGDEISFVVEKLMEDTVYSFFVRAINQFGNSSRFEITLMTTDVQDVIVACQDESTISITCTYLSGSDASGCVYTLVSMTGVDEHGTISRGDTEEVAVEQTPYRDVVVYDLENDGTIGRVPIRRDISSIIASCFSTTDITASTVITATLPPTTGPNIIAIVIPVIVVVIMTAAVIILVLVIWVLNKKVYAVKQGGTCTHAESVQRSDNIMLYEEIQDRQINQELMCEGNPSYGIAEIKTGSHSASLLESSSTAIYAEIH